ncbi:hypothetical protein VNO77_14783 [Canavalia gladiata]|uniref:Uncharacterized protein n=1 Tax=Canavalia gladiata TaxID=3824 RepID=A0AAN9LZ12_CANGL
MKVPSRNLGLEEKETLLFQTAACRKSATDSTSGICLLSWPLPLLTIGVRVPFHKMGDKLAAQQISSWVGMKLVILVITFLGKLDSTTEDNNGVVNPEDGKPGEVEKFDKMDEDLKQEVQAQVVEAKPKVKDKEIHSIQDEEGESEMMKRHLNVVFVGHVDAGKLRLEVRYFSSVVKLWPS